MDNDKSCLLYAGYTFFFRYRLFKRGQKWVCTNFPRCKAYLCVDDDYYIVECMTQHNHVQKHLHLCPNGKYFKTRIDAQLITMSNGKETLLYGGYTFFLRSVRRDWQRWVCTRFPKCKADVNVNECFIVLRCRTNHNHDKQQLYRCPNGTYIKKRKS